jgi:hypothetical protein
VSLVAERRLASQELVQSFGIERQVSALERVQVTFAMQINKPLEILVAAALLALRSLSEIVIGRLSVTWSSRHV